MRHRVRTRHLNRTPSHRKAMLRNMAASLLRTDGGSEDPDNPGRIITTVPKAKECRHLVERLVTLGKKGGVANQRRAIALLGDKEMVHKLFNEIAPRYANRQGGYTRILHLSDVRLGDAATQCVFELVEEEIRTTKKARSKKSHKKVSAAQPSEKTPKAPAEEPQQPPAEDAPEEQ
ncbi:MAG: 50S ribosomal protein L17 [Planctomycetes bacterium]|nr:50S ribosomal protein L17 [Planctomycetota bacterium]